MTQMAQLFPRHAGPTHLYLNFDGWTNAEGTPGRTIYPFVGTTADIENILFQTAEVFAPFDVEVSREYGNGTYATYPDGSTTIFIGGDTANVDHFVKNKGAQTPGHYTDYATQKNPWHQPNSDAYDLAFVDPMGGGSMNPQYWNWVVPDQGISQAIIHEAGHTFGLAHVVTQFFSPPTPEAMSYDSLNTRFKNETFFITDLNGSGSSPENHPYWGEDKIIMQNSFTFLEAVLGDRPADGMYHVADASTIDPGAAPTLWPLGGNVSPNSQVSGFLSRQGDYDVYRLDAGHTMDLRLSVVPNGNHSLIPVLLICDGSGNMIPNGFIDSWNHKGVFEVHTDFHIQAGQSYYFVVGAAGGNSTGGYGLSVARLIHLKPVHHKQGSQSGAGRRHWKGKIRYVPFSIPQLEAGAGLALAGGTGMSTLPLPADGPASHPSAAGPQAG
jgi:hypothetical protein